MFEKILRAFLISYVLFIPATHFFRGSYPVLCYFLLAACNHSPSEAIPATNPANSVAAAAPAAPVAKLPAGVRVSSFVAPRVAGTACAKLLTEYETMATTYAAVAGRVARFPTDHEVMAEYSWTATRLVQLQEAAEKLKENGCGTDTSFMRRYSRMAATISQLASAHAARSTTSIATRRP